MRKRGQARKPVNHDEMWITVPPRTAVDGDDAAETTVRSEPQPTYEDTWYQVLRTVDDEPGDAPEETRVATDDEPGDAPEEMRADTHDEGDLDDVPARPDHAPQHASSLD